MRKLCWLGVVYALGCCTRGKVPETSAASPEKSTGAPDKSAVVAVLNGESITEKDLDSALDAEYRKKEHELYELKREKLDGMIIQKLVQAEAKKAGLSEQEYLKQNIDSKIVAPTEMEAKAFYEQNKDEIQQPFDAVKNQIVEVLKRQREQQVAVKLFQSLRDAAKVDVRLPEPEEPRVDVDAVGPSKGPTTAPVTIVEFSDFQCPFCQRAANTVGKVLADYAGQVRLVYRQFPLEFHDKAFKAAEAGMCANEQGKFWEMHDHLFGDQKHLDVPSLKEAARSIGLDGDKFDKCLDSGQFADAVRKDMTAGQKAGVSGTPAFFINGRMISGAQPYESFREVVDQELKRKPN